MAKSGMTFVAENKYQPEPSNMSAGSFVGAGHAREQNNNRGPLRRAQDRPRINKATNRSPFKSIGAVSIDSSRQAASPVPVKIRTFSLPPDPPLMTQKSTKQPPVTIHRKDYTAPAYWVNTVEMGFDIDPAATRVATRITLQRNSASPTRQPHLIRMVKNNLY